MKFSFYFRLIEYENINVNKNQIIVCLSVFEI